MSEIQDAASSVDEMRTDAVKKEGLEPKDMEYIITYDMPSYEYLPGQGDKKTVFPAGTVVKDVKIERDPRSGCHLGYDFTAVETGQTGHTYYPWALAENTPENLQRLKEYQSALKMARHASKIAKYLGRHVATLENK